jgi:hypothetical protein
MKERKRKRGQIDLSFGMIFSIILIIAFLVFGFFAIKKFLELQDSIKIQTFLKDFQDDVDKMWKSSQGSQTKSYYLPNYINAVCFQENRFENLKLNSSKIINGKMIEHIDITKITEEKDPFCIANSNGKISLTISKDYGEILVTVKK